MLLAALAGCSGDDDEAQTSTTPTPSSTEVPTGSDAEACPETGLPDGAQADELAEGDVDGDGVTDELRTYRIAATDDWRLQVTLAAGGGAAAPIVAFGDRVGVIGGADVDGDGRDEVWIRTGAGASATIVGLVRFDDCELSQVGFAAGTPADLPVGGSVGASAGLECSASDHPGADLTAYRTTLVGDGEYEVSATEYALEGDALVERGTTADTVHSSDPDFLRYASFRCGPLSL